jgi:histidine phosphotransferase ChpT
VTPNTPSLRLAEALCGRFCHELSSPLGTLAGALEMLGEGRAGAAEAQAVANETAVAVRARMRLLRAAWTADCPDMPAHEMRALTEGLRATRRVRVVLDGLDGQFPGPLARLLLNVLLLGVECLAGNGVLTMAGTAAGVTARLEGPRAAWPESLAPALADEAVAWSQVDGARTLQAPLLAILAHADGVPVRLDPPGDDGAPPILRLG